MNKKLIAALSIPGLIVGGTAVAGAQTADDDVTTDDAPVVNDQTIEESGERQGRRGHKGAGQFAEALGIEKADLKAAVESGQTIAEVAADNGVDIDTVIADMVAEAEAKVAENPDSERAQNFDAAELTERLTAAVNGEIDFSEREGRRGGRGFPGGEAISEALGLESSEIREAVQGGSTIADLAEQQGVDLSSIVDQLVADAEARIAENPDSERAQNFDADEFEQRVTDRLNGEGPERGERGDRGPRGDRGAQTEEADLAA